MTIADSPSDDGDVVEVEFTVTDPVYPFVSIAEAEDCRFVLEKLLPRGTERSAEYFSVADVDPEHVAELARENGISTVRILAASEDGGLVEFVVEEGCPALALADLGAVPTTVEGTPAGGKIVAEIMPADDPGPITEAFVAEHAVELVAKRPKSEPTPLLDESDLQTAILDRLTDRQREVLTTAYEAGYYQRPRNRTGEEVADDLAISPTTFQEHVRAAERKLVTFLVQEEIDRDDGR